MTAAAAAATFAATALLAPAAEAAPAPTSVAAAPAKACTTKWKAKQRVAVRRPAGPVATMDSPIHHYLRKGQVVRSCVVAVARTESGPAYRACGGEGHFWRIVPGGQVPQSCLKRL